MPFCLDIDRSSIPHAQVDTNILNKSILSPCNSWKLSLYIDSENSCNRHGKTRLKFRWRHELCLQKLIISFIAVCESTKYWGWKNQSVNRKFSFAAIISSIWQVHMDTFKKEFDVIALNHHGTNRYARIDDEQTSNGERMKLKQHMYIYTCIKICLCVVGIRMRSFIYFFSSFQCISGCTDSSRLNIFTHRW